MGVCPSPWSCRLTGRSVSCSPTLAKQACSSRLSRGCDRRSICRPGANRRTTDLQLIPKPSFDYSQLESVEVKAPAPDGTMIPLSIVYKRGIQKDSRRPTMLEGYGSYGITLDPMFVPRYIPWLERGGVWAIAHVRGGGEYGEDWHNAGRMLTKQNNIGDMISCAEYLVKEKYTAPAYLAGQG